MVEFEDFKGCVCLGVNGLADELATKRRYLVVEQIQFEYCFKLLDALADCTDTLILTEGLPQAHGLSMWVALFINGEHNYPYLTYLSESVIALTPCHPSSSQKWN